MKPEDDEEYVSEYTRFLKNSRGVPDDFQNWIEDLHGSALRKPKKKNTRRQQPEEEQ
jgi:hypothetical protein